LPSGFRATLRSCLVALVLTSSPGLATEGCAPSDPASIFVSAIAAILEAPNEAEAVAAGRALYRKLLGPDVAGLMRQARDGPGADIAAASHAITIAYLLADVASDGNLDRIAFLRRMPEFVRAHGALSLLQAGEVSDPSCIEAPPTRTAPSGPGNATAPRAPGGTGISSGPPTPGPARPPGPAWADPPAEAPVLAEAEASADVAGEEVSNDPADGSVEDTPAHETPRDPEADETPAGDAEADAPPDAAEGEGMTDTARSEETAGAAEERPSPVTDRAGGPEALATTDPIPARPRESEMPPAAADTARDAESAREQNAERPQERSGGGASARAPPRPSQERRAETNSPLLAQLLALKRFLIPAALVGGLVGLFLWLRARHRNETRRRAPRYPCQIQTDMRQSRALMGGLGGPEAPAAAGDKSAAGVHRVSLEDVGLWGARINRAGAPLGDNARVEIFLHGAWHGGKVVWSNAVFAGVEFATPLDRETLVELVGPAAASGRRRGRRNGRRERKTAPAGAA
jgi:hypothetical protein